MECTNGMVNLKNSGYRKNGTIYSYSLLCQEVQVL